MTSEKTILFPIDFSESSLLLLRKVVSFTPAGASYVLLHVVPPASLNPADEEDSEGISHRLATEQLDRMIADYLPKGARAQALVLRGDTSAEILRAARERQVDLVVMPTHGATGWRQYVLGSVTDEIVRLSPCPVLTFNAAALSNDTSAAGMA